MVVVRDPPNAILSPTTTNTAKRPSPNPLAINNAFTAYQVVKLHINLLKMAGSLSIIKCLTPQLLHCSVSVIVIDLTIHN